jgi:hypothetical protein
MASVWAARDHEWQCSPQRMSVNDLASTQPCCKVWPVTPNLHGRFIESNLHLHPHPDIWLGELPLICDRFPGKSEDPKCGL